MAFGNSDPIQSYEFPPPNYNDPTTRVPLVIGLTTSTCALALLLIGGRLYARAYLMSVLGTDDWTMFGAAILAVTLTGLGAASCLYGLGYHIWDLRPEWEEPYYKIGFVFQIVYPLCVGLTKISICQTYLRIFPSHKSYIFSHAMTVLVGAYTITCLVLMFSQCHPLKAYWANDVEIHCVDMHANMMAIGIINTITDFLVYLWPSRYLWRIQLPLRQRIGLVFVFTCGLIVSIAGVFRLIYLNLYFTNIDLLWDAALTTSVAIVEVNIGVVCGCLHCVKPLLAKILPSLFDSSQGISRTANPTLGESYHFPNMMRRYVDKNGATSIPRDEDIEVGDSDEYSTQISTKPMLHLDDGGKVEAGTRDSSSSPDNDIVVDQILVAEKSQHAKI